MKKIYPDFYKSFQCIAAKCPDSCCKDWDIVVDDESAEYYNSLKSEFAAKLKNKMTIDEDGDRIFKLSDGKCPFWNKQKLCDIYINIGEEHLCKTCRRFPRITQDYTAFAEYMLSFACPQAARIMLKTNDFTNCFQQFEVTDINTDYSSELMNVLIFHRTQSAKCFSENTDSFASRLINCLEYNKYVQSDLDGFDEPSKIGTTDLVFDLHSKLDFMNKDYLNLILSAKDSPFAESNEINSEFTNLAYYYLFRYYLTAADTFDVIAAVKRLTCAYIVISKIISYEKAENDFEKRVMIFQQYSKEVEHSYENCEILADEFYSNKNLSCNSFIHMLKCR